jgi:hypothetical protein
VSEVKDERIVRVIDGRFASREQDATARLGRRHSLT